jgi:hypothetical protein
MKRNRILRWTLLIGSGTILLQTSCFFWDLINTTLLGITAAGAIGILRNL